MAAWLPPDTKFRTEHASLEDLLTGQSIEDHDFDLSVPEQAQAAKDFEQDALRRYGQPVSPAK